AHRNGPEGRFDSIAELDAVPYVGALALQKLRDYAKVSRYDGVSFDAPTAAAALQVANLAAAAQLTGEAKITSTAAQHILAGRPFASLAAVSATYGIGTATMQALHDYAGKWKPATCTVQFGAASVAEL